MSASPTEFSGFSISRDVAGNVYTVGCYLGGSIDLNPGTNPGDTFILHSPVNQAGGANLTGYISKLDTSGHFGWGQRIWSNHYAVTVKDATTDAVGNVYTTGTFQDTAHFGALTFYAHPNAIMPFAPGDAFVCKQDAQGNFIWIKQIGGNYGDDGRFIALSPSGNIVVLGAFSDTMTVTTAAGPVTLETPGHFSAGIFVASLRPSGDVLWIKQLGNDSLSFNSQIVGGLFHTMSLDAEGNIYFAGMLDGTVDFDPGLGSYVLSGSGDMAVCKLSAQGDFLWARKIARSADFGSLVSPQGIFAGQQGNIYITGNFQGKTDFDPGPDTAFLNAADIANVRFDIFISKWDNSGNFSWVRVITRTQADTSFVPPGGSVNQATSIFADELGNVYTTGSMLGYMDMNSDTAVADTLIFASNAHKSMGYIHKLDAQGNFQWAIPIKDKEGFYRSVANQIIKDDSGHLYVTGNFDGTVDFDPNGGTYNLSGGGAFVLKLNDTAGQNSGVGIATAEMKSGNIQLYPNPAGHELWLKSNGKLQLKTVLVYNLLGQELRREKVSSGSFYRMDVRSLAPGFYLLKALLSDGSVAQGKFEVRR
ncbi:MAG TPA: T9SS type A sorting domain-containing protein [Edaphocola sp.]|nr:T9SS type A sorting domain-containing protein [Edaphocola sp.]